MEEPYPAVLSLYFHILSVHRFVPPDDEPGMVPAADSWFGLLEKYEVEFDEEEESCYTICLEEIGGGGGRGALRMSCAHVFHGSCIEGWPRKNHYCPLCRYEMPTE